MYPLPPGRRPIVPEVHYAITCGKCAWKRVIKAPVGMVNEVRECSRCDQRTHHTSEPLATRPPITTNEQEVPLVLPVLTIEEALAYDGAAWGNALTHRDLYGHQVRQKRIIRTNQQVTEGYDYLDTDHVDERGEKRPRWKPVRHFSSDTTHAWHAMRQLLLSHYLELQLCSFPASNDGDAPVMVEVKLTTREGMDGDFPYQQWIATSDYLALVLTRAILAVLAEDRPDPELEQARSAWERRKRSLLR